MPLWNNEEWRARIGSCWCVLGGPGKSKSSENYQSYDPVLVLSGRTLLQAVHVLLVLVFIQGAKSVNGCWRQLQSESQTIRLYCDKS